MCDRAHGSPHGGLLATSTAAGNMVSLERSLEAHAPSRQSHGNDRGKIQAPPDRGARGHGGGLPRRARLHRQRSGGEDPPRGLRRARRIDQTVSEGDLWKVGSLEAKVFEIPGHTTGHIAFYFAKEKSLFCGDTLFTLGCGRLFEGTPEQMWKSLDRLRALPPDTKVYCGHEYTAIQTKFCLVFEPQNQELIKRTQKVLADTTKGIPTVPSTLEEELKTNPFLRPQSPEIREHLGLQKASDGDVFRELRWRKDQFR